MLLANDLVIQELHQVEGAQATKLTDGDVSHQAREADFDDWHISLVNKDDLRESAIQILHVMSDHGTNLLL